MEKHPGQQVPNDFESFPGKMDHATAITIRIGKTDKERGK